jgi:hypothetical protein
MKAPGKHLPPIPGVVRSHVYVWSHSVAAIAGSNPVYPEYSSLVFVAYCVSSGPCEELVTRSEEFNRVCMCVCLCNCNLETSTKRLLFPPLPPKKRAKKKVTEWNVWLLKSVFYRWLQAGNNCTLRRNAGAFPSPTWGTRSNPVAWTRCCEQGSYPPLATAAHFRPQSLWWPRGTNCKQTDPTALSLWDFLQGFVNVTHSNPKRL